LTSTSFWLSATAINVLTDVTNEVSVALPLGSLNCSASWVGR
jgi:hypothetical protein